MEDSVGKVAMDPSLSKSGPISIVDIHIEPSFQFRMVRQRTDQPRSNAYAGVIEIKNKKAIPMTQRENYVAMLKPQLAEIDEASRELAAQAERAHGDVRGKYRAQMGRLRAQLQRAAAMLSEISNVADDAWEDLVADMEAMRDALISSFRYYKSQFYPQ